MAALNKKLAVAKRSSKALLRTIETSEPADAIAELRTIGEAIRAAEKNSKRL